MSEEKSAYRQVFKATSLFGGVQFFQILISVVRSKVIAVLLGSYGMGVSGLLNTSLNLISELTSAGLGRSAVKDLSAAVGKKDVQKVATVIGVLKRLIWITGLFGAVITLLLSPLLSRWAFDSEKFTLAFCWVALALLFKQLSSGHLVVLQGLRKLKLLAKANLTGSIVSLVIVLPLYYYFRVDAVAPAIAVSFLMTLLFSWYFAKKAPQKITKISTKQAFFQGKEMIRLGVMMSISSLLVMLVTFLLQLYISNTGTVHEVGLYHAGVVIVNSYVGLIFNAMGTDYYPRLAEVADDIKKVRKTVMQQAHIAILLITPIIILFLLCAEYVIVILYSKKFLPVVAFLIWAILGTLFKAVSFSMGYIFIAKGDSKIFVKTAVFFNSLMLSLNVLGYYWGGLKGLGISFLVYYILHFVLIAIITKVTYNFYFQKSFYKLFFICICFCTLAFLTIHYFSESNWQYLILAVLFLGSAGVSLVQLQQKMDLREVFRGFTRHKKNK